MSKRFGLALWALGLLLVNVLLFLLERGMTPAFWLTFAFVWAAFVSSLVFQAFAWKKSKTPEEAFLHLPVFVVSIAYELAQIPVCIIFALGSAEISGKTALLVQAVLLILAWIAMLLSLGGNEHIKKVNSRQKNNHKEL